MNKNHRLNNPFIITSISLFALSLTQKCYCSTSNCTDSFLVFLLGGLAVLMGGAGITWLANPLLIACWFLFKRELKTAMWLSVGSTLISLSFLLFDSVLANESGQSQQVIAYKPGYWLWVLSNITMLVATFIGMFNTIRKN